MKASAAFRVPIFCLLLATAASAGAGSTICSNPARAGVRATMDVALQAGGAVELEDRLSAAARDRLNMSAWLVSGEDPYEQPPLETRNLILQSPQSSVAIHVRTSNRKERARITLERTCISDALEPWRPYWQGLRTILREQGYNPRPR